MGYEVLGSGGASAGPPAAGAPLEGVVDLGTPEQVASPVAVERGHGRTSSGRRRPPPWVTLVAVAAAAALVGGLVVDRHDDIQRRLRASAALYATATVTGSQTSQGGSDDFGDSAGAAVTLLSTELSNYGPVPVTVVVGSTPDGRRVTLPAGASPVVARGGHLQVDLQLTDPCRSDLPRPHEALPVRTADGTSHDVDLTASDGDRSSWRTSCSPPSRLVDKVLIRAEIMGTTQRTILRLSNLSQVPVRFDLSGGSRSTPAQPFAVVRVSTRPALPLRVPPGGVEDVLVRLVSDRCQPDLSRIRAYSSAQVIGSAPGLEPTDVGLPELSVLAGAAVARACGG